jgi:hypothetical protein
MQRYTTILTHLKQHSHHLTNLSFQLSPAMKGASMHPEMASLPVSTALIYPSLQEADGGVNHAPPSTKTLGAEPLSERPTQAAARKTWALEDPIGESPDMNTTPDASGGSVSSF